MFRIEGQTLNAPVLSVDGLPANQRLDGTPLASRCGHHEAAVHRQTSPDWQPAATVDREPGFAAAKEPRRPHWLVVQAPPMPEVGAAESLDTGYMNGTPRAPGARAKRIHFIWVA